MTDRDHERFGALAGLAAALAVGVPVLLDQLHGAGELVTGPAWLWWACYLGFLAAFVGIDELPRRFPWLGNRTLLAVQVLLGAVAVALAPSLGWMPVLLIVTIVTAAFVLERRRLVVALAAAQSLLIAVTALAGGAGPENALLGLVVYGSLQGFAMLMVWSSQREAAARIRLAEANVELRAAQALLAESTRNAERVRIARELHDLVGHQLTALALELEVASHRSTPPASEHVTRARRIAKDLLADVRAAVGDLRSPALPLRESLEGIVADLPRPRVHLRVHDGVRLDGERRAALVRCVQEIVTNTVRHADADNLWIELAGGDGGTALLAAHDDGCGAPTLRLGNGLTGMRERVEQLGGAVSFDARDGFRVAVEVPVP